MAAKLLISQVATLAHNLFELNFHAQSIAQAAMNAIGGKSDAGFAAATELEGIVFDLSQVYHRLAAAELAIDLHRDAQDQAFGDVYVNEWGERVACPDR